MSTVLGKSTSSKLSRQDPIPGIRPAGHKVSGTENEAADYSLRQDVHLAGITPSTPEHLKKYRKSHVNQPGQIQKHYGVADDGLKFPPNYAYGRGTHGSEHVDSVMSAGQLNGMQDKFNDIKEGKYASKVKEPLGHGFERGYNWPDKTNGGNIEFGLPAQGLDNAKEMLYPLGGAS